MAEQNDKHVQLVMDDGRFIPPKEFISPGELYADLIKHVREYHPSDDISLIEKAYKVASEAHKDQRRKSGEPYIIHPLCVAIILAKLQLDQETIAAGLLHDVVEDTDMTDEDIAREFGIEAAQIVDGVTKLDKIKYNNDKLDYQAENLRRMFLAMAKDIRVIMVKLADRLHNMRTLAHQPELKQKEIARETMDIYAPLAQRLGISKLKVELDDLSLKYLEPEVYRDLVDKIAVRRSVREAFVQAIVDEVSAAMEEAGIKAKIDGRVKHFFSIYKKMVNQDKTLDQIYDLFAIRIIVDTIEDCYAALGIIHKMFTPIPGRFKDYIAMPKPNMYQSLHTTLIGKHTGTPFEIQIRTYEMHKTAEYGIAAHWKYKVESDGKKVEESEAEKMSWLRQILEWQQDMADNREFLSTVKSDLDMFSDNVYCFTPTGDVKTLPTGSTPIDFAYAIHSAVGNRMVGAKVNGEIVNIDYILQTGDRVEITTSQNTKGPSRDWLNIVKSTQAKNKINQWFRNEFKEENIIRGKELILAYIKTKGIEPSKILVPEYMDAVIKKYGFKNWDAVRAAIGHGGLREGQVVNKMIELYDKDHPKILSDEEIAKSINDAHRDKHKHTGGGKGIVVQGTSDLSVRFSKCCAPIPGDEIIGFVTRGNGVSIHRTDCINIMNLSDIEKMRLIDAEWSLNSMQSDDKYLAEINIYANDRFGLLLDITKVFTEKGINIMNINSSKGKNETITISFSFEVTGTEELAGLIKKINTLDGIIDIERARG